jgi:hypothetical protein
MTSDASVLTDSHLDIEIELPRSVAEMLLPDLYIGLDIDLLSSGDGIVTDKYHASTPRYEADDPMNQIEGQISPFMLSGWLRHGCEQVVQIAGATVCHPGEPNADYMHSDVYERDLDSGYHEKGACLDEHDDGCIVYDLFGGFGDRPGKLLRRPVSFSPIRRQVDVLDGEAEAHYRQISNQVRSRNEEDGGQPLRKADCDVLGNVEGTWKLTLRELKPEFVGLLLEAVSFLDAHSDEFEFQVGGARNFGAGIADVWVMNPLYSEREVRRMFNRAQDATTAMAEKDEVWASECRPEFVKALQARTASRDGDLPVLDGESGGESA